MWLWRALLVILLSIAGLGVGEVALAADGNHGTPATELPAPLRP
jgi:hypothetical protein